MYFFYIAAMALAIISALVMGYSAMQVLKIDANTSAVGIKGKSRGERLRDFVAFAVLAPVFAAFALGIAGSANDNIPLFVIAGVFTAALAFSAPYVATSIVETPLTASSAAAEPDSKVTQLHKNS